MHQIPNLKLLSKEELYCLLSACAESLTLAYQAINQRDYWYIAMQARLVCDALQFEINAQKKEYSIH